MSIGGALLRLDIFRKLPKDLTEPTFCGALGKYIEVIIPELSISLNDMYRDPYSFGWQ